jgi:hypothetical protein
MESDPHPEIATLAWNCYSEIADVFAKCTAKESPSKLVPGKVCP